MPVALREPHRSGATQNGSHCSPRPFYERRLDHESILSRSGRAMAHDEEQDGHSVVKQKPVDSDLKNTHLGIIMLYVGRASWRAPPGFCRLTGTGRESNVALGECSEPWAGTGAIRFFG